MALSCMAGLGQRAAALLVPALAGCSGPLSTLDPKGPAASAIATLWWGMLTGAVLITLLVVGLLALGWARSGDKGPSEGFWLKGMGLGFSALVLSLLLAAGLWLGEALQPGREGGKPVLRVEAVARQWAWRFHQPGPDGALMTTENRLFVPAGQAVDVVIRSEDVIHAFWVPQLAGKLDAIPGRDNLLRIAADAPGIYHGTSAEFSGLGYAAMRFVVIAYDPDDPADYAKRLRENSP